MELVQTTPLDELTQDPFELEILTDDFLEVVEPDDPYYREITLLQTKMSNLRLRISAVHYNIAKDLLQGISKAEIIRKRHTSYATIAKTVKNPTVQEYVAVLMRSTRLRKGPSLDARAALLWRIAVREEDRAPRVSIAAVDAMNKQEGVYQTEDAAVGAGLTVNVQNFIMSPDAPKIEKDITPTPEKTGFTPVTVHTP